ncbi:hypothetical protein OROHE_007741 [Orobanche hederae]
MSYETHSSLVNSTPEEVYDLFDGTLLMLCCGPRAIISFTRNPPSNPSMDSKYFQSSSPPLPYPHDSQVLDIVVPEMEETLSDTAHDSPEGWVSEMEVQDFDQRPSPFRRILRPCKWKGLDLISIVKPDRSKPFFSCDRKCFGSCNAFALELKERACNALNQPKSLMFKSGELADEELCQQVPLGGTQILLGATH